MFFIFQLELLQKTGSCPLTADELLNLNSKNTDDVDKLEEIVIRLVKFYYLINNLLYRRVSFKPLSVIFHLSCGD